MNIRKIIAGATSALLVGGALALATALPASAHTPEITDTCHSITAHLTNYEYVPATDDTVEHVLVTPAVPGTPAVPAVYETVVVTPAVEAVPGKDAVTHTEYEFEHKITHKTRWEADPNWNAEGNEHSKGWFATGNTRVIVDVEAVPAVPAVPAVTEQHLVTAEIPAVPGTPAVYNDVTTPGAPAQDNTITLILDGTPAGTYHFGHTFDGTQEIDGTVGHTYQIIIDAIGTAYDKTIDGTTEACYVAPPVDNPPVITTETQYGDWTTPVIDCTAEVGAQLPITREVTVVTNSYDPDTEETTTKSETTTETGVHVVTQAEVDALDCPVVVVPPTEPPVVNPPVVKPPVDTPVTHVVPVSANRLAYTGTDVSGPLWAVGVLLLAGVLLLLVRSRRKQV